MTWDIQVQSIFIFTFCTNNLVNKRGWDWIQKPTSWLELLWEKNTFSILCVLTLWHFSQENSPLVLLCWDFPYCFLLQTVLSQFLLLCLCTCGAFHPACTSWGVFSFWLTQRGYESTCSTHSLSLVSHSPPPPPSDTQSYSPCLSNSTFSTSTVFPSPPADFLSPDSLCPPGHGKDWKFDGEDEGRRRCRHPRRRKRREGESPATPSRPYPPGIHPGGKVCFLCYFTIYSF